MIYFFVLMKNVFSKKKVKLYHGSLHHFRKLILKNCRNIGILRKFLYIFKKIILLKFLFVIELLLVEYNSACIFCAFFSSLNFRMPNTYIFK